MALIRSRNLPVRKSTPLDACALDILSVSCINVGMKRKEMDIISAISWTGNFTFLKGCNKLSIASVISIGVVVSVNRDVIKISKQKRNEITSPILIPPKWNLIENNSYTTGPSFVKNKCNKNVNMIKNQIGVSPFKIKRIGMNVEIMVTTTKKVSKP